MNKTRSLGAPGPELLSRTQQETIEELLYRLLDPVGSWREELPKASRGRRWKKLQRRKDAATKSAGKEDQPIAVPESPEVLPHLTVGFNSTMRRLESLCHMTASKKDVKCLNGGKPKESENNEKEEEKEVKEDDSTTISISAVKNEKECNNLAVVFICQSTLPAELVTPISLSIEYLSKTGSGEERIQMIPLSRNAESRLAKAMRLPRVGVVGLEACHPAATLIDYVRGNLPLQ